MRTRIVAATLLGSLAQSAAWSGDCEYAKDIDVTFVVPAEAAVEIIARAGDLVVSGDGSREVIARGRACASSESRLDELDLVDYVKGGTYTLEARIPDERGWGWRRNQYAYIDLTVQVPNNAALAVKDSSGDLRVRGVGALRLDDSSGDLEVSDVSGDLDLRDSSGEISVRGVAGSVTLVDSSGGIDVDTVDADVVVRSDSSGDINISDVGGAVTIERDSSGSIDVRDVGRSVEVGSDSSGDIRVANVQGDFRVRRDGSGSIRYDQVDGAIDIPDKS